MKIFIDPGHGGSDSGAVANGFIEKVLNLQVSLKLQELLKNYDVETKMSRETDIYVDLNERCNMANSWGADYFISIHHNAGGGDGYEIIHSIYAGKGKSLAEAVSQEFIKTGQNFRRIFSQKGSNGDYFCVIRETTMPAIITEYAFLDTTDVLAVDTIDELHHEAEAICSALVKYLNITKKVPQHWAQKYYDFVTSNGVAINETRFDDSITRGEVFKLMAHLMGYKE